MGHAVHTWLTTRNRWQSALMLFAVGALMALGFAPYHLWPVLFISLPVFYFLLTAASSYKQAAWRAFYFGYGYSMAGTWWIANALLVDADKFAWMLPFSVLGLSAVMAAWFVLFGMAIHSLRARMHVLLFAVLWVLVEYARSIGIFGFPWNLLGYVSLASLPLAQVASLVGTYGLSFILLLLGLLPALWLGTASPASKRACTLVVVTMAAACYGYGQHRLATPTQFTPPMLRVVQPNVPQALKGTPEGQKLSIEELGRLTNMTGMKPDVTIWPETAYPFTLRDGVKNPIPHAKLLITGAVRAEGFKPDVKIWNSLVAMDSKGNILATYDKHQLVPFGEFVPLRNVLPLEKITPGDIDFTRGAGPQSLAVGDVPPFSPLICYEAIFPWIAVDEKHRPAWLLNVTNDGWYGDSAGPYQHFDMARMRAIEQGLPLVRAANSGISAVFDSYGRVVSSLGLNARGQFDTHLPASVVATPYATHGEFITFCAMSVMLIILTLRRSRRQI